MITITDYEIVDHGIEYPDYFQGCGTDEYEHVVSGVGDNPREALDDCIEMIAQSGDFDLTQLETGIEKMPAIPSVLDTHASVEDDEWPYYYISVRWND